MEQNDFERQLKEQFSKRSITPSPESWKRLEEQLNDVKPVKKINYWLIASVGVVFLIAFSVFKVINYNDYNDIKESPEIVEKDSEVPKTYDKTPNYEDKVKEVKSPLTSTTKQHIVVSTKKEEKKSENTLKTVANPEQSKDANNTRLVAIEDTSDLRKQKNTLRADKELIIDAKALEVASIIIEMRQNNKQVTDAEIEALLLKAQREINSQRILDKTSGKVDAMALLSDVEEELDQSFKEKVLEAIKVGYRKVKTAVAQRNN